MKKILISMFFFCITLTAWSQTTYKSIKEYKQDRTTIVKDSTGALISSDIWFLKVQSGDFTIVPLTAEGIEPKEFLFRKCTIEERRRIAEQNEKRAPISLAGFTTGKPLKDFTVVDVKGNTHSNASLKGKIVVLDFWYKDAGNCKEEIPQLNKLVSKYKTRNVVFIAPTYDPVDEVKEFLKTNPFSYIICTDVEDMIINLNITKYPTHVVIDANGMVTFVTIGQTGNIVETLTKEIDALL